MYLARVGIISKTHTGGNRYPHDANPTETHPDPLRGGLGVGLFFIAK